MKNLYYLFVLCIAFSSCQQDTKKANTNTTIKTEELSIAQKIANAHGFENWDKVSKIAFTFNVDRDSSHYERSWTWNPKTNAVTMTTTKDTVTYNHKQPDSTQINADKGFINDKYWLLLPFQLVWDSTAKLTTPTTSKAPISNEEMNKITLTYPADGGYTPGDAYDIFYGDDYMIKEWVFREANTNEATLTNTFENHKDFNGIKIAQEHKKLEGNWNLNFTDIKVELKTN